MKYLNKRTGAVVNTPCTMTGPDWECMEAQAAAPAPPKAVEPEKPAAKAAPKKAAVQKTTKKAKGS